jgi:hypothetical protein
MSDIQDILSSISDEDMAKIRSVAQSIMGENKIQPQEEKTSILNSMPFDENTLGSIMNIMGKINKEDSRTRLIADLKPLLSEERRKKADDAIRFLQLMEVLPLLKGMF